MSNLTTAWMLGCVCGFFLGVTAQGWRRRYMPGADARAPAHLH
jgi:hypothetical protein